ncbi:MAG: hypothetical protein GY780_16260 [bacterium]|nr:hypothetical protein [bacterium]
MLGLTSQCLAENQFLNFSLPYGTGGGESRFGTGAAFGDFGDGPVLVVGAPHQRVGDDGDISGGVFALYGPFASGLPSSYESITGPASHLLLGNSISFVDNYLDGQPVFVAGGPYSECPDWHSGAGFRYHLEGGVVQEICLGCEDSHNPAFNNSGNSVTSCDFNGDGYKDIVLGSKQETTTTSGKIRVYLGGPNHDLAVDVVIESETSSAHSFGMHIAGVQDLNSDLRDEIIFSSPSDDRVYIVFGRNLSQAQPYNPDIIQVSDNPNDFDGIVFDDIYCAAVAGGVDVTGDGIPNLVISDDQGSGDQDVLVFSAPYSTGQSPTLVSTISGDESFGETLCIDGDYNEDGISDLLIGCPSTSPRSGTHTNWGMLAVFLGGTFVAQEVIDDFYVSTADRWYISPDELNDDSMFGTSLGAMPDQNGDNRDDIYVGAPGFIVHEGGPDDPDFKGRIYGISPTQSEQITLTNLTAAIFISGPEPTGVLYASATHSEGLELLVSGVLFNSDQTKTSFSMSDNGEGWDEVAGDGIFTSELVSFEPADGLYRVDYFASSPWSGGYSGDGSITLVTAEVSLVNDDLGFDAVHPLPTGPNQIPLLAVTPEPATNYSMSFVKVDASSIGGPSELILSDSGPEDDDLVAGDDVWSVLISEFLFGSGTQMLPFVARDEQYSFYCGEVLVELVDGLVVKYEDASIEGMEYTGQPYSSVVIDSHGDGDRDVFISRVGLRGKLFLANGLQDQIPAFEEAEPIVFGGQDIPYNVLGLATADYDNDGSQDLFCASQDEPRLYHNTGTGSFSDALASSGISPESVNHSVAAAWGDYDLDGRLDLAIGTADLTGVEAGSLDAIRLSDVLLHNQTGTNNGFQDVSIEAGISTEDVTNCLTVSWCDIDSDGYPDLFYGDTQEDVTSGSSSYLSNVFVNNGQGSFSMDPQNQLPTVLGKHVSGIQWADFNNDGSFDMALSSQLFSSRVCLNNGAGEFELESAYALDFSQPWKTAGLRVLDHDLDGSQDILFLPNDGNGYPVLIGNTLSGSASPEFSDLTPLLGLGGMGKSGGAIIADFNGDGDSDILLGRADDEPDNNKLDGAYKESTRASGSGTPYHNWLAVELSSPSGVNNSMGIGSVVRLNFTDGTLQTQLVDGGSGRGGQADHSLVFGVGTRAATDIESIVVIWPNGFQQIIDTGIELGGTIQIADSTVLVLPQSEISGTYHVLPNRSSANLIFEWDTNVATPSWKDEVTLLTGSCRDISRVLDFNSPGVEIEITRNPDGTFHHRFTWAEQPCIARCVVDFMVKSATGNTLSEESFPASFYMSVCGKYVPHEE